MDNYKALSSQCFTHRHFVSFPRYLHLFDYIQRAHQIYNDRQKSSIGYNALRQLELQQQQQQQQKRKQLLIQQQMQRRQRVIEQQKLVQQREQNAQREMMEKQRQQREALTESPTAWRNPAYQNWQNNLQSNGRVDSRFVAPVRAVSWSSYPKTPLTPNGKYSAM